MSSKDLQAAYKRVLADRFPPTMEISFLDGSRRQTLVYERVQWTVAGEKQGLRYGENPGQEAALYKLINGSLTIGNVTTIAPGRGLTSDLELLRSGKHPGKTNLTDVDSALTILRGLSDRPSAVVIKHNNPSGVGRGSSAEQAYTRAYDADSIAAFGGAVAVNRPVDRATAEAVASAYCEVVAAPDYEDGTVEILARRKNLRVMRIGAMDSLETYSHERVVEFKSLLDGGIVAQLSYQSRVQDKADLIIPEAVRDGVTYTVERAPTAAELDAMLFGWKIQAGIISNSVIFVDQDRSLGIGAGEQDRVGVAEIARDKAYSRHRERTARRRYGKSFADLDNDAGEEIRAAVAAERAELPGSAMVSDGFFPFRDGVLVGLREGVASILQPGGSLRDWEVIQAVNEYNTAMMFTGERVFRH